MRLRSRVGHPSYLVWRELHHIIQPTFMNIATSFRVKGHYIDIAVFDSTFRDVRSCKLMHVMLAATLKQPALTNSRSTYISRMDM